MGQMDPKLIPRGPRSSTRWTNCHNIKLCWRGVGITGQVRNLFTSHRSWLYRRNYQIQMP